MHNCWIIEDASNANILFNIINDPEMIIISVDGMKVNTKDTFFEQLEKSLLFPGKCEGMYARFEDWMTDLSWIPQEKGICIYINAYDDFLKRDSENKVIIEEIFKENILPFWDGDVLKYVKGGKTRRFFVITKLENCNSAHL